LCKPHLQEIGATGEMEGAGLRGKAGTLLHQLGDIFRGERLIDKGVLQCPGHGLRSVDVTQGHALADVMVRIEAPLLQRAVIRLCLGGAREKAPEELMSAGFFPLLQERLRVIGIVDVLAPVLLSRMASHEGVPQRDTPTSGGGFERQDVASLGGWNRRPVGLEGKAQLPGGTHLGHGGEIKRMQGEGRQRRPFFVP
jgi:hypothetical protein